MSKAIDSGKWKNIVHLGGLLFTLTGLLGLIGFFIGGMTGAIWVTVSALILYFFTPTMSSAWMMRFKRAMPISEAEMPWLISEMRELSQKAGLTKAPKLYFLPQSEAMAFTTGKDDDSAIGVSRGLLNSLSETELTAVLAHEISHIRNKDVQIKALAGYISRITRFMSMLGQIILLINIPLLLFGIIKIPLLIMFLLITAPIISFLIELAISRSMEFEADRSAVQLTGRPKELAYALLKIEHKNRPFFYRMFFPYYNVHSNTWLSTHPDTKERINRIMEMDSIMNKKGEYVDFVEISPATGNETLF